MVGQRIKVIEDNVAEFDVSSSMENKINDLDAKTMTLSEKAQMMSDEDYDYFTAYCKKQRLERKISRDVFWWLM